MAKGKLDLCKVCGYQLDEPPWGETNDFPSFDICPCCGVEFGYEDSTLDGLLRYRKLWISRGASWFDPKLQPKNWNLDEQLARRMRLVAIAYRKAHP